MLDPLYEYGAITLESVSWVDVPSLPTPMAQLKRHSFPANRYLNMNLLLLDGHDDDIPLLPINRYHEACDERNSLALPSPRRDPINTRRFSHPAVSGVGKSYRRRFSDISNPFSDIFGFNASDRPDPNTDIPLIVKNTREYGEYATFQSLHNVCDDRRADQIEDAPSPRASSAAPFLEPVFFGRGGVGNCVDSGIKRSRSMSTATKPTTKKMLGRIARSVGRLLGKRGKSRA